MSSVKDPGKERRFWRALASEQPVSAKPVDLTHDLSQLNADEQEARRQALKHMLNANEERQRGALRNSRPTMALGERIAITSGDMAGSQATVLDADFINGRVQLQVDGVGEPQWLSFKRVGNI